MVAAGPLKDEPFPKGFRLQPSNRLRRAQDRVTKINFHLSVNGEVKVKKLETSFQSRRLLELGRQTRNENPGYPYEAHRRKSILQE